MFLEIKNGDCVAVLENSGEQLGKFSEIDCSRHVCYGIIKPKNEILRQTGYYGGL